MKTQDYLKYYREEAGLTQVELAEKLYLTRQAISKWERGESYPDIENIIILSDLYDISIDELLRGAKFLEKPHVIGKINDPKKFLFRIILIAVVSILFFFNNLKPLALSTFLTFNLLNFLALKDGGFILERNEIKVSQQPTFILQVKSLFPSYSKRFKYKEIKEFKIIYKNHTRFSPFDFNPDLIYITFTTYSGESFSQVIDQKSLDKLPIIADFIAKKRITVIDEDNIVDLKLHGENLYTAMNS